ncbi:MAG: pyruvate dehydrogenase (acetyl-transferring), homodimeric type [Candidatus Eisenbacteria bacterium]|uniref:Pyruvate dehydrogenase E1 component n=1 Tax=Eiseniibacteriota bacterium TaxID=2212470 RepID=A0A7Y2EB23_UNCEI|nr:pyruvate dehydrogenase (acetyl-transferring), homodimeric type [Candidatus Eisenbacteria bacterium]
MNPVNRDLTPEELARQRRAELERLESKEWIESLDYVIEEGGPERVKRLLRQLQHRASERGIHLPYSANTPYTNTVPRHSEAQYPGNREIERRIKSIVRWNAMAMVVRANREQSGIGGHISTYASAATLLEVGFNHFFKGKDHPEGGDQIYFQGHSSPGIYGRAFLEGRISEKQLTNFRQELYDEPGLSSYPHPWLMPDFWEFPTVSMGLGPLMAIYQARFNRYLEDRGLVEKTGNVWAFLGDGETDEPESLGAISLAAREKLDNLHFVINCNLQRLDGPVRGNYKIIQELEAVFRGAGWNVIKVVWGSAWDPLLEKDREGLLAERMELAVDGDYQKYVVEDGGYVREHFFGANPELKKMVEHLSDDQLKKMRRGGHDPQKVFAAYQAAMDCKDRPTVILAKTVKGYGLGEAGEGKNITHQQKKLNEDELREFRSRFGIPISDEEVGEAPFYRPADDSIELQYMREQREKLGGPVPERRGAIAPIKEPPAELFSEFDEGSGGRDASTTMVFVRLLAKLLRNKELGPLIVPIVPDEARTFGMEALFRQVGIYSHVGQKYEPVDRETLLYYKEAIDGQILEEGITEAGSMSSFIAAGTAYATHNINMIPFFIYYSMFGLQRVGDLIWAAGDMRCKGFLLGATSGRTTLAGEGLQHQDGHSHLLAYPHPTLKAYDPAFAYELAVIIQDGIKRMYVDQEDCFYYLTVGNEPYDMPAMPEGSREGILKGLYKFRSTPAKKEQMKIQLLGSGAILNEVLKAQEVLRDDFDLGSDVWSVTSYKELFTDALETARYNRLHPEKDRKQPFIRDCLGEEGVAVAASDYTAALPISVARWAPRHFVTLGTDGFGRSAGRTELRDFFEVDHRYIVLAALGALHKEKLIDSDVVTDYIKKAGINRDKANPLIS